MDCQGYQTDPATRLHDVTMNLESRYCWPTAVQITTVPGFSEDYNGCRLVCIRDEQYNVPSAQAVNRPAGYILMENQPSACRGSYVFCLQQFDDNNNFLGFVGLCRKDILNIAEYSFSCSRAGSLPDRIHFDNIRRQEALVGLKAQNFQFI